MKAVDRSAYHLQSIRIIVQAQRLGFSKELRPTSEANAVNYPVSSEDLSGLTVLLIAIPYDDPRIAYFLSGQADCDGHSITIVDNEGHRTAAIPAPREALSGFDPSVLSNLIVPEHYGRLVAACLPVDACIAVFTSQEPGASIRVQEAFFGLATGTAGQPLLMQGDPEPGLEDGRIG